MQQEDEYTVRIFQYFWSCHLFEKSGTMIVNLCVFLFLEVIDGTKLENYSNFVSYIKQYLLGFYL